MDFSKKKQKPIPIKEEPKAVVSVPCQISSCFLVDVGVTQGSIESDLFAEAAYQASLSGSMFVGGVAEKVSFIRDTGVLL